MITRVGSVRPSHLMQITTQQENTAPAAPTNTPGSNPAVNGRA
jgi:hypothetical protein